jgi:exopolyphosphatase / guanosine-5'-triphosphate,3'-diphosphate pyrophosphatase
MKNKFAVIDMGTNTFQYCVAQVFDEKFEITFEKSFAPKIGKGGISDGIIKDEAIDRALIVLHEIVEISKKNEIGAEKILAFGTSALRNAKNGETFCKEIKKQLGINVQVISGEKEAELIVEGVKYAVEFNEEPYLVMDIGGGSVEFIIANKNNVFWKQSFEIGGQRLMDLYFKNDPIHPTDVKKLQNYLEEKLIPLANAMHQYSAKTLVGSAGSFETLVDIYHAKIKTLLPNIQAIASPLPIESFYDSYYQFLEKDRNQRMEIPGMIELRVDIIVVASVLIDYIIKTLGIAEIIVSNFALKEGVLAKLCRNELL